jgi:hypothetical protein
MIRGTEKPHRKRQSLCRYQTALTLHDVGVATLCPGRETKSVAANLRWSFQHPDSNATRIGVALFLGLLQERPNAMLLKDFPENFTLGYSVHVLFILLQSLLMRVESMIENEGEPLSHEDREIIFSLIKLIDDAQNDAHRLERKILN